VSIMRVAALTGWFLAVGNLLAPAWGEPGLRPVGVRQAGTVSVTYEPLDTVYRFRFVGDETIEYEIDLSDPAVLSGQIRVRETTSGIYPIYSGGVVMTDNAGAPLDPDTQLSLGIGVFTGHSLDGNTVTLSYADTYQSVTVERAHEFTLSGKSLRIRIRKTDARADFTNNYIGTTFGASENASNAQRVLIPYMENMDVTLVDGSVFYQTFVDFTSSSASYASKPAHDANYLPASTTRFVNGLDMNYRRLSGDVVNPLDETLWLTVSSNVEDTFVLIGTAPSPYREEFGNAYVLNFPSLHSTTQQDYPRYLTYLDTMYSYGVRNLMIYLWSTWAQQSGASNTWPDALPPNPGPGHLAELQALVDTAVSYGYRIGAYTYYYAFINVPENDYWDPVAATKDANGQLKTNAWGSNVLAGDAAVTFGAEVEQDVQDLLGLNLAYEDTLSGHMPHQELLSEYLPDGHPSTIGEAIATYKTLFSQSKAIHDGPYLGEGSLYTSVNIGFDSMYAGYVDAWERHLGGCPSVRGCGDVDNHAYFVIPDYELKIVKPLAVGLGFGFPQRFKLTGYPIPQEDFDEFLATYISYGHVNYMPCNGIVGDSGAHLAKGDEVRSYYMLSASLQPLYLNSATTAVEYCDGDNEVYHTLSDALKLGLDLENPRLRLSFANGLVVYVNHHSDPWTGIVLDLDPVDETFTIPQNGWVAHHPDTGLLEFSAIPSEHAQRFDYVLRPDCFEMLDGRGQSTNYGSLTATDFKVIWANGFTVTEATPVWSIVGWGPPCCDCPPGDLDEDGDVDLDDFTIFVTCMNGPDVPYPLGCEAADLDTDTDVDLADFGVFQLHFGSAK